MTASFSRPWNPSTLPNSIPGNASFIERAINASCIALASVAPQALAASNVREIMISVDSFVSLMCPNSRRGGCLYNISYPPEGKILLIPIHSTLSISPLKQETLKSFHCQSCPNQALSLLVKSQGLELLERNYVLVNLKLNAGVMIM